MAERIIGGDDGIGIVVTRGRIFSSFSPVVRALADGFDGMALSDSDLLRVHEEIYRQTERRLKAQLDSAVARDQRALVVTGFSVVSSGLAVRASEGLADTTLNGAAALLLVAAIIGAASALPRRVHGLGGRYQDLSTVIPDLDDYATFVASLAEKNDEYIRKNDRTEFRAITLYWLAILFFALGALAGVLGILI